MMQLYWPLTVAAVIATARAQFPVCNATINQANASGIFPFAVDYPTAQNLSAGDMTQYVPDPSWALTVSSANGSTEKQIWYDTAGQNYSNDLALEYDVCTFFVTGLTQNTLELGQDDPGDCTSTFSTDCSNALRPGLRTRRTNGHSITPRLRSVISAPACCPRFAATSPSTKLRTAKLFLARALRSLALATTPVTRRRTTKWPE